MLDTHAAVCSCSCMDMNTTPTAPAPGTIIRTDRVYNTGHTVETWLVTGVTAPERDYPATIIGRRFIKSRGKFSGRAVLCAAVDSEWTVVSDPRGGGLTAAQIADIMGDR